ncbi:hypothetical protein ACLBX9_23470 [Methylobacterium sp. A49B]
MLPDPTGVAYVTAPDRLAGRPIAHRTGFAVVIQVDGYAAYESLAHGGAVHPLARRPSLRKSHCPCLVFALV